MFEKGVMFGDKHTFRDWKCYLRTMPKASAPEPDGESVYVPGRDGNLNLIGTLDGYTHYKPRQFTVTLTCLADQSEWANIYSNILDTVQGKQVKIVSDYDREYYYVGLGSVSMPDMNNHRMMVTISAECDAFKYEKYSTVEEWTWDDFSFVTSIIRHYSKIQINGDTTVEIIGSDHAVYPKWVVTSTDKKGFNVTAGDNTFHLDDGESVIAGLPIGAGKHTFTVSGKGLLSIEFRGGRL